MVRKMIVCDFVRFGRYQLRFGSENGRSLTGQFSKNMKPPVVLLHQPSYHQRGLVCDTWELQNLARSDGGTRKALVRWVGESIGEFLVQFLLILWREGG
jgi:hypothetical protein